jgi:ribonuclease/clavin/mitogillin
MLNIVNVGYDSANYYVIETDKAKLLIDVGWPGTLPKLLHTLKRIGIPLSDITHLLVTHYHPDHAGLAQELKQKGVKLIVLENQVAAIPALRQYMDPESNYVAITLNDNIHVQTGKSRLFLHGLGIDGEIIITPGHTDDSITLILDIGVAFTGDLPPVSIAEHLPPPTRQSWEEIRTCNVHVAYPGHGPAQKLT